MPRYPDERSFVWDHRKATDAERTATALGKTEGKRLTYRVLKSVSEMAEKTA